MNLLPYQVEGVEFAKARKGTLIADEMGLGKLQAVSEPILTPNGWKFIGEIIKGDHVIGLNGQPTLVTGVFPQGVRKQYRVTLTDGANTRCGMEHLWYVETANTRFRGTRGKVLTLREILDIGLRDVNGNSKWFIPVPKPVHYNLRNENQVIKPYLLGALIANGCLTQGSVVHSGTEEQKYELNKHLPEGYYQNTTSEKDSRILKSYLHRYNQVKQELTTLNVFGKYSWQKRIPPEFLYYCVNSRKNLLAGLLDNDGCISKDGMTIEYNTTSKELANDVLELIRSLGGVAWVSTRIPKYTYKGEKFTGKKDYRIRMALDFNPFKVFSKAERFVPRTKYPPTRAIEKIEECEEEESVCIKVDAPDQLYITKDFIPTHNTIQAIGVINACPEIKSVLIICPNGLKLNWWNEIDEWLDRKDPVNISVVNYEMVEAKKLRAIPQDLVIIDEGHFCKNPKTKRTVNVKFYAKLAKKVIVLTGTPFENMPLEMWPLLQIVNPERWDPAGWLYKKKTKSKVGAGEGAGFFTFAKRYCGAHKKTFGKKSFWVFNGASNTQELGEKLRESCMIRRKKEDVLSQLPEKQHQVICLPSKLNEDLLFPELDEGNYVEIMSKLTSDKILFEEYSKRRHDQALEKVELVAEHVLNCLEEGKKIILFAHHKDVIEELGCALNFGANWEMMTSDMSINARHNAVTRFQNDDKCRVIIGSIGTMGVGWTLTASSHVIFAEIDPRPGTMAQCVDRAHRIGQRNMVLAQYLVLNGTLDARICKIMVKKLKTFNEVLG